MLLGGGALVFLLLLRWRWRCASVGLLWFLDAVVVYIFFGGGDNVVGGTDSHTRLSDASRLNGRPYPAGGKIRRGTTVPLTL